MASSKIANTANTTNTANTANTANAAYVAFGEDESLGFNGDDVLNRPSSRSFDEPPWRVIDSDVEFKPMFVDGHEPEPEPEPDHSIEKSIPDDSLSESATTLEDHSSITSDSREDAEWAEVETLTPESLGITEDEVNARIEEAIAEVKNDLTTVHKEEIQAREEALSELQQEHNRQCEEIREVTASEFEEKLKDTLEGYRELTAKIKNASSRVSEFFEPLSRLSVHIASQLVRGELNVGPVAITRLVQGCLDAVEDQLSKQDPVLRMHPDDLEMFLTSFSSEPEGVKCIGDDSLARGDVSLQIDGSVIDDLIAHRLEEITSRIFGSQQGFSDQFFRESLGEVTQEQDDLIKDLTSEVFEHERDHDSNLIADETEDSTIDEQAEDKIKSPDSSDKAISVDSIDSADQKYVEDGTPDSASKDGA